MRRLDARHPAFDGHFPGDPLLPGAYLLALVLDEARAWLGAQARRERPAGVRAAKFTRAVRPGEPFACEFRLGEAGALRFAVKGADGVTHASGVLAMQADGAASIGESDA